MFTTSSIYPALKGHWATINQTQIMLPSLDDEERVILEQEGIISTREKKLRSRVIKEYLIKWKDLPEEEASWETEAFRQQHLSLCML